MNEYYVIMPGEVSRQLEKMTDAALYEKKPIYITDKYNIPDLKGKKLIISVELDEAGFCIPLYEILAELHNRGPDAFSGSSAIMLLHSQSELFTKSTAAYLIFLLNRLGCRFPGHPLVEATASMSNFLTWKKNSDKSIEEICLELCYKCSERLEKYAPTAAESPKILALHSSPMQTSNTITLWNMVKANLKNCEIKEFHVENGKILDCIGCSFTTCVHYSNQNSCFYGGVMVEEIMPAIEYADAVAWLCPNYNDSVSANLMAVINRMTALYRRTPFYKKTLFAVIVSGNSGSDSVAKQLIDALCINKGFNLPPYFSIMATANDSGAVLGVPGINEATKEFAYNIMREIKIPHS